MSLKFYHINEEYIKYLRTYDQKVTLVKNAGKERPYIGIVFKINEYSYFAPLSSPKKNEHGELTEKYKRKFKKSGSPLFEKIEDLKYGTIQINNMIPVPQSELVTFDIEDEKDEDYKSVLKDQFIYIDNNEARILKKAQKLYQYVTEKKIPAFVGLSCEFKLLEQKCDEYSE